MARPKKNEVVEKKRDWIGNPEGSNRQIHISQDDNNRLIGVTMAIASLPDIDLKDAEQVKRRIAEYFDIYAQTNLKPTVSGLAMSLGMDRRMLHSLVTGSYNHKGKYDTTTASLDAIKKAYKSLELLWEGLMQEGKMNVVAGIFLGKNNYGYVDQVQQVVIDDSDKQVYDIDELKKRYDIDDE